MVSRSAAGEQHAAASAAVATRSAHVAGRADPAVLLAEPRRSRWPFIAIGFISVLLGALLFVADGQGVYHDAFNYYTLAQLIATGGLFGYSINPAATGPYLPVLLQVKPNGYPFLLSLVGLFSTFDPERLRVVVFGLQLCLYILICRSAAARLARIFDSRRLEVCVFAATALNPWLLVQTTEMLSDLVSAALVYLSVVLALPVPARGGARPRDAVLSCFLGGLSTTVRSANVAALGALGLIWIMRWLLFRNINLRLAPLMLVAAIAPFTPQVVNNVLAFGSTSPFVARNEYATDLDFGARTLKYLTVIDPTEKLQWVYANPLLPEDTITADEFMRRAPLGYVATLALHGFTLLDQDYPLTFVTSLHPWYRWPSSLGSWLYIGMSCLGLWVGLRKSWQPVPNPRAFALLAVTITCLACLAIYIPPHVENRYSLPLYPLLGLPFACALLWVYSLLRAHRLRATGWVVAGMTTFVGGCAALSAWVSSYLRPLT
jgi:hypothetical protein